MTYKVLPKDIKEGMIIFFQDAPHRVIDTHFTISNILGFTLLQLGKSKPKMFYMESLSPHELYRVSLKYLLKNL